jgi:hypothetical protein
MRKISWRGKEGPPLCIDVIKPALKMTVGRFDTEIYKSINGKK